MPTNLPSRKIRLVFIGISIIGGILLGFTLFRVHKILTPLQMFILILGLVVFLSILEVLAVWWENRHKTQKETGFSFEIVGKTGVVQRECSPEGTVKVDQVIWNAVSYNQETLKPGDKIVVRERQGLKLHVQRTS